MASYTLKGSYPTVQVLSPTLVQDIQYCTIETSPSNILAAIPVQKSEFDAGTAGPLLTAFADGIETVYGRNPVIAATGTQQIDANQLLADFVTYTVQYVPPGTSGTEITADAPVPVGLLSQSDPQIADVTLAEADAIIQNVYANLKSLASG